MSSSDQIRKEVQELTEADYKADMGHLLYYAFDAPESVQFAGTDEFHAPHPPKAFYEELGRRAADFAAMHPRDAAFVLPIVFRYMTTLTVLRAKTNRAAWRKAFNRCTVDLADTFR